MLYAPLDTRYNGDKPWLEIGTPTVEKTIELPVMSLLRFKSVSKKWKSTVEDRRFQERQLICRKQSRGPDFLFTSLRDDDQIIKRAPIVFSRSEIVYNIWFRSLCRSICHGSCDGLVCLYDTRVGVVVANPATRWYQTFHLAKIQHHMSRHGVSVSPSPKLGFGRDKLNGTYKPVFLYNSYGFGLDNVTTCSVRLKIEPKTKEEKIECPVLVYRNQCHIPVCLVFISGEFSHLCKRVMIAEAETKDMMEEIQSQKKEEDEDEEEGPPPGWESTVLPPPPISAAEISGIFNQSVFRGSRWRKWCVDLAGVYFRIPEEPNTSSVPVVRLLISFLKVGQVKCSNCELLLMYPYGAPSVRCSSCKSVTDIREDNKRPPWSVLQGPLKTFSSVR
ncbi:hypothetical protein HID58_056847 [Brassica napus]|uniref:Zinc finger LSD1-type domain-containing protein n=1 Tax=Brassica napus TaxID=3708 RepID=A0ABQ8APP5_BRANA|nr:hypothetical protein HID58_056847 [Brassica napus]